MKSNSIFDSFKFIYHLNKLSGFLFFTTRTGSEGFYSVTTAWDIAIFLISLSAASCAIKEAFKAPFLVNSRSIILDIGSYVNGKTSILHPAILIIINFYHRHDIFQILHNLHWIDAKV